MCRRQLLPCTMCHRRLPGTRSSPPPCAATGKGPPTCAHPPDHAHSLGAAPQGSKGHGREVKATPHDARGLLRAAHLVQPLTSRDRTLLGSSSSRVKMSPRFTVSWDPSSNSTCPGHSSQAGAQHQCLTPTVPPPRPPQLNSQERCWSKASPPAHHVPTHQGRATRGKGCD